MYLKAACAGSWRNRCQHEVKCARNLLEEMPVRKNRKEPEEALRAIKLMHIWPWVEGQKEGTEEGCVAVVQLLSCVWLCNPMDCSMPGFPVLHYLPEFAQTHVHWVGDAIQPPHPLLPPVPASESFPMSRFFTSGSQSIGASVNIQWTFRVDFL